MHIEDLDARWQAVSDEMLTVMTHRPTPAFGRGHGQDWRVQHPTHRPTPAMRGTWASDFPRN
jgi:hypothetical protein